MRIEARPENFECEMFLRRESSEMQWFANSSNPKQDLSVWSLQAKYTFDSVRKSYNVDPFSLNNRGF